MEDCSRKMVQHTRRHDRLELKCKTRHLHISTTSRAWLPTQLTGDWNIELPDVCQCSANQRGPPQFLEGALQIQMILLQGKMEEKFGIILESDSTPSHIKSLMSIFKTALTFHSSLSPLCWDRSCERRPCTQSPLGSCHSSVHEETGDHQQGLTDDFLTGQEPEIWKIKTLNPFSILPDFMNNCHCILGQMFKTPDLWSNVHNY